MMDFESRSFSKKAKKKNLWCIDPHLPLTEKGGEVLLNSSIEKKATGLLFRKEEGVIFSSQPTTWSGLVEKKSFLKDKDNVSRIPSVAM